jgi:hypothetical protein
VVLFPDIKTVVLSPDIKTVEIPKILGGCVSLWAWLLVRTHGKMQQKILLGLLGAQHLRLRRLSLGLRRLVGRGGARWDWGEWLLVRGLPNLPEGYALLAST